ncbi:MAG: HEAT repeat domain-containing protein [Planctomycetota bacterium]|nr:HEAT repeat domain-containing protein [Planctomycetota bacterium]
MGRKTEVSILLRQIDKCRLQEKTEEILSLLSHSNPDVRVAALRALKELRTSETRPIAELLNCPVPEVCVEAVATLIGLGAFEPLRGLAGVLKGQDTWTHKESMRLLSDLKPEQGLPILTGFSKHPDPLVRRKALRAIIDFQTPLAFESLLQFLDDPDPLLGAIAVEGLSSIGGDKLVEQLSRIIRGAADGVRLRAIEMSASAPDKPLVGALVKALESLNYTVQRAAAERLRRLSDMEALPVLVDTLGKSTDDALEAAGAVLSELFVKTPAQMLPPLFGKSTASILGTLIRALEKRQDLDHEVFIPLLRTPCREGDSGLRGVALEYLLFVGTPSARQLVLELSRCEDKRVRTDALRQLYGTQWEEAQSAIRANVSDPDADVRHMSAKAALDRKVPDRLELCRTFIADSDPRIRRLAVERMAPEQAEWMDGVLHGMLKDPDRDARHLAMKALVARNSLGSDQIAFLSSAIRDVDHALDPDWWKIDVRQEMIRLLPKLNDPRAFDVLDECLSDASFTIRLSTVEALRDIGGPKALDLMAKLEATNDLAVLKLVAMEMHRQNDHRAGAFLIRVLDECKGEIVKAAREALKNYAFANDISFLIRAIKSPKLSLRRFAAGEVKNITDESIVPHLLAALDDDSPDVRYCVVKALAKFTKLEGVLPKLIGLLEVSDLSVREAAVDALGDAKCLDAIQPLIRLLANVFLRNKAEEALKKIGDRKGFLAIKRRQIRDREIHKHRSLLLEVGRSRMLQLKKGKSRKNEKSPAGQAVKH